MRPLSSWLDDAARGAAERQLRGQAGRGPAAAWGARRFSRRTAVGTAAAGVAGISVLRHVTPAFADADCVAPCLAEATRNHDGTYDQLDRDRRIAESQIQKQIDAERVRLFNARTKKQRAASQARLAQLNQQLQQQVLNEILGQLKSDQNFENNRKRCLSDSQCGDPKKYPGGSTGSSPPPGGTGGGTQSCAGGDHPCNCGGDVTFLCCLPYFTCGQCCGS